MLRQLGARFEAFFRATTPDPFVLAVLLTLVVFAVASAVTGSEALAVLRAWQGRSGFWSLLAFSMQMVVMLVAGHALAATRVVRAAVRRLAAWPRTGAQAAALVAAGAVVAALVNWGLGLIVGALLARDVGRSCQARGVRHHYPLLVASGYVGLMAWHGGLSGSAPLKMTTAPDVARFLGEDLAMEVQPVPFTDTVLSLPNAVVSLGLLLLLPALAALLMPAADEPVRAYDEFHPADDGDREARAEAPALSIPAFLEQSPWTMLLIAVPLAAAVILFFRETGIDALDPNAINLVFITAGLLLHGSLKRYARAVEDGVQSCSGIVLQFPFYAGIMGVMRETGLAAAVADLLVRSAPPAAYAVVTFLSAGFVNLFVPSGGGQWAVQGPIAVRAALELDLPISQVIMAVAYGDQCTNMLQPFWALPLLAITGAEARDIIGYTALIMLVGGAWMVAGLMLWPWLI